MGDDGCVLSVDQTHFYVSGKSKKLQYLFDPINPAREKEKCKTKKSWVKKKHGKMWSKAQDGNFFKKIKLKKNKLKRSWERSMNFEGGKCKAKVLTIGLRIVNFLQLGELLF